MKCHICLFVLSDKETLISHIKLHKGRKRTECVMCDKSYGQFRLLREHLKTHVSNKLTLFNQFSMNSKLLKV